DYLLQSDQFLAYLDMPPGASIDFKVDNEAPAPPLRKPVEIEKLSAVESQRLSHEAAEAELRSSKSKNGPDLSLVAQVYGAGVSQNSSTSFGNAASGTNPRYYMGIRLNHTFGNSGFLSEDEQNKRLQAEIADLKLTRLRLDTQVNMLNQEKKVQ